MQFDCTLKVGEKKYLTFVLLDADKYRVNISSSTIVFQVQKYGESTLRIDETITTHSDPTDGETRYLYEGQLPVGEYKMEIEEIVSPSVVIKYPTKKLKVESEVPSA